jgi:hypothetical protein
MKNKIYAIVFIIMVVFMVKNKKQASSFIKSFGTRLNFVDITSRSKITFTLYFISVCSSIISYVVVAVGWSLCNNT